MTTGELALEEQRASVERGTWQVAEARSKCGGGKVGGNKVGGDKVGLGVCVALA